jgi:uncharacterized protein YbcV (DUF1398 family)
MLEPFLIKTSTKSFIVKSYTNSTTNTTTTTTTTNNTVASKNGHDNRSVAFPPTKDDRHFVNDAALANSSFKPTFIQIINKSEHKPNVSKNKRALLIVLIFRND